MLLIPPSGSARPDYDSIEVTQTTYSGLCLAVKADTRFILSQNTTTIPCDLVSLEHMRYSEMSRRL